MPVPTAREPPHDCHAMRVTRPVGSPPLKILDGFTCPKPVPCANIPARRPRVGIAPGAGAEGRADGEAAAAGLGAVTGAAARPGLLAVTVIVTAGAGPACDEAEQPVTAARLTAAMAAAAPLTGRRAGAPGGG